MEIALLLLLTVRYDAGSRTGIPALFFAHEFPPGFKIEAATKLAGPRSSIEELWLHCDL